MVSPGFPSCLPPQSQQDGACGSSDRMGRIWDQAAPPPSHLKDSPLQLLGRIIRAQRWPPLSPSQLASGQSTGHQHLHISVTLPSTLREKNEQEAQKSSDVAWGTWPHSSGSGGGTPSALLDCHVEKGFTPVSDEEHVNFRDCLRLYVHLGATRTVHFCAHTCKCVYVHRCMCMHTCVHALVYICVGVYFTGSPWREESPCEERMRSNQKALCV